MVTMTEARPMTADELARLPEDDRRYELVRGELVAMAPPGGEHGNLASRLNWRLAAYVEAHALGAVLVEAGFRLARDPDTVRGPDISFLAAARIPPEGLPTGFIDGAPDLAVEIVSPGDTATEVDDKVQQYLAVGARLVWVVHPRTRSVTVYRQDRTARVLSAASGDRLDGEDVVAGFGLPLAELFKVG